MNWAEIIYGLVGGLGIFLFGLNYMGDSLKDLAGNKLKYIIEKTTNTPLKGILIGALVTLLIQSSSATTALTVGLVRAGLMTLPQAAGVIMGANIGTTITAFLIGLNIGEYALVILGVGALMTFLFKKASVKHIGGVIMGFGMLFYGLEIMGSAMSDIAETTWASNMLSSLSDVPILGLFVGAGLTAVIQSSSATIGILQKLYSNGGIALMGSLAIMLGSNVGTTVTALMAGIGGSKPAKRAALFHVVFNVVGAIIFMCLLRVAYLPLMEVIEKNIILKMGADVSMTIAIAHLMFNLVATIILFFFINKLVMLVEKIIPGDEEDAISKGLKDDTLIEESPVLALEFAKTAINHMGDYVKLFFDDAMLYSFKNESKLALEGQKYEDIIDNLDRWIHDYLIKITKTDIGTSESHRLSKYLDTIRDLERIGDHCMNLVEFFQQRYSENQVLSEDGERDLHEMYDLLLEMLDISITALITNNKETAKLIADKEDVIDTMEEKFRKRHILRLNSGQCKINIADNYVDILSNLERIGDHCNNIAENVICDFYVVDSDDNI